MSNKDKLKNIGLGTALILCVVAATSGYYLVSGPLIDSISIQGRGWADTLASVIFAGIFLVAVYSVAFILILIGAIGSLIITISFFAARINQSISPEEHRLVKWALGMLTVKKLLKASLFALTILAVSSYGLYELDSQLSKNFRNAIYQGDFKRTKSLLRWRVFSNFERSGIKFAAEKGHLEIVELLIEEGFPIRQGNLDRAAENGHMDVVQLLIENGASVQEVDINWVARGGHTEIVKLLLQKGAKLKGARALSFAARYGHTDLVALLIDAGVELNECKSNDGYDPPRMRCVPAGLDSAIYGGHIEIIQMLVEAGADVLALARTMPPRNFIQIAKRSRSDKVRELLESALELPTGSNVINAAKSGDWERLKRVVLLGAPVNQIEKSFDDTYGWTALMYASDRGLLEIVEVLVSAGADVAYSSPNNETALYLATKKKRHVIVKLLKEAGAERH